MSLNNKKYKRQVTTLFLSVLYDEDSRTPSPDSSQRKLDPDESSQPSAGGSLPADASHPPLLWSRASSRFHLSFLSTEVLVVCWITSFLTPCRAAWSFPGDGQQWRWVQSPSSSVQAVVPTVRTRTCSCFAGIPLSDVPSAAPTGWSAHPDSQAVQ